MGRKLVLAVAVLGAALAVYVALPWHADLRAFDPVEMARLETAMWRDYYEKRYPAPFYHLHESCRAQFGFSRSVAQGLHCPRPRPPRRFSRRARAPRLTERCLIS